MDSRRIDNIEYLRGVAALAVVLCHAVGQFHGVTRFSEGPIRLLGWGGQIGVALFFVISGFCIRLPLARARAADPGARLDVGDYARRRALRILPAYWVAIAVSVLVGVLAPTGLLDGAHQPFNLAVHALGLHSLFPWTFTSINGVFWTIGLEIQFYAAYLLLANRPASPKAGFLTLVLAIAVYGVASKLFPNPSPWRIIGQEILLATFWQWYLGAILADAYVRLNPVLPSGAGWTALLWAARAAAVGACLGLGMDDPVVAQVHLTYWALPLAATALVASFLVEPERPAGRPSVILGFFGRISYSLYLFHPAVVALVALAVAKGVLPNGTGVPLVLAGSVLTAMVTYRLIERPFLRYRSRRRPSMAEAPASIPAEAA